MKVNIKNLMNDAKCIASYSKIKSNIKYLTGKEDESLRLVQDSGFNPNISYSEPLHDLNTSGCIDKQ